MSPLFLFPYIVYNGGGKREEAIMNLRKAMLIGAVLLTVLAAAAYSLQGSFAGFGFGGPKVLVAYFSRAGENYAVGRTEKGNTAALAEIIADETGGDLFEIKTKEAYPEKLKEVLEVARREQKESARPELAEKVNLADYDIIFLGYPNWCSDMPMAVYTFLETNDFEGKTIIPFSTSLTDSLTGNEKNIPLHAKGAKVLDGLGLEGKFVHDTPRLVKPLVKEWLDNLNWKEAAKNQ